MILQSSHLFDNVGNITTAKKIADYFKSQRIRTSVDTILNYIGYMFISMDKFFPAERKGIIHLNAIDFLLEQ